MKRILMTAAALASLAFAAAPSPAQAATSVGISVQIGDPYRGASFRFSSEPDLVLIPSSRVYYVDNYDDYYGCDMYRYGSWWYLVDDGYWYRSRNYRGPFYRIGYTYVPRVIYSVGPRYRRHWGGSFAYRSGRWNWHRGDSYGSRTSYSGRTYRDRDGSTYRDRDRSTYRDRDRSTNTRERTWTRDRTTDQSRTIRRDRNTTDRSQTINRDRGDQRSGSRERTLRENRGSTERGRQVERGSERGNRGEGRDKGDKGDKGNKGGKGRGRGSD
jgi:hypothetical protein